MAKINLWLGKLRDCVLTGLRVSADQISSVARRCPLKPPSLQRSIKKPITLPSTKNPIKEANETSNSDGNICDFQQGDSIEASKTPRPQNGFVSRALYYRGYYIRR
ncbi:GM19222 [Drosophila sechellia]|uniref:GM19222 n=2 Tax=Drosophila sechellia TaxID=7238 RepID=B4I9U6_DROSE|nr:GM19222 [Drosophila sechellia]